MEEEIDDLVGEVQYTDSQKSVTTSNAYSPDFTDSSSDKNHSSGKDTYVIDRDDSDDSEKTFHICHNPSIINLREQTEFASGKGDLVQNEQIHPINKSVCTSFHKCSVLSQEIFTQTSKTIFELVNENDLRTMSRESKTLQTQTSFMSVTENKTIEYKIEVKDVKANIIENEPIEYKEDVQHLPKCEANPYDPSLNNSQDTSTKYPESETQNEITEDANSDSTCSDRIIQFIDAESEENIISKYQHHNSCEIESSKYDSDIEEDSLTVNEYRRDKIVKQDSFSDTSVPKSIDNDVEELYNKISESIDVFSPEKPIESNLRRFGTLTPLTEETVLKKDSIIDVTPSMKSMMNYVDEEIKPVSFTNNPVIRPTASAKEDMCRGSKKQFKLPPIHKNKSCPNSPNLNFLFAINTSNQDYEKGFDSENERLLDRWEIGTSNLAGGESPLISGRSDPIRNTNPSVHLPPIQVEGIINNINNRINYFTSSKLDTSSKDSSLIQDSICIKDKIKSLKESERKARPSTSRTGSPTSGSSPEETRLCDAAERGCEALCCELLRRLRSSTWTDVAETLEELPHVIKKFWVVLAETRIADLLRQVTIHVDSPRTQVARLACASIAEILKNTNYTKKPDFFEAVTTLLTKTGSFSRPVRRAANVALDQIMSSVDLGHTVTALCVHGVSHKSALVRCASARLLVVCCALGEGGRQLLRARPPSVATARRHALRALATLLDDKNAETRKYAERLYTMLRPLTNFEAYFLTDVDVELASRQMKRFDQILMRTTTR